MANIETVELFKILSADTRIAIINLLKHGPMNVSGIADSLGISQSAVSQHLRLLKSVDLVSMKREGYWVAYSLNSEKLLEYRSKLSDVCTCGCYRCCERSLIVLKEYKSELEKELERLQQEITKLETE